MPSLKSELTSNVYVYVFTIQEIVRYVIRSLQEKKLLYFGVEYLGFSFIDPVSTNAKCATLWCTRGTVCPQRLVNDFHVGSVDSRRCCTWITEGYMEVRKTARCKVTWGLLSWCNVNVVSFVFFFIRAEKEKMNEKRKQGEQQVEVDDSGFFAGKPTVLFWFVTV